MKDLKKILLIDMVGCPVTLQAPHRFAGSKGEVQSVTFKKGGNFHIYIQLQEPDNNCLAYAENLDEITILETEPT